MSKIRATVIIPNWNGRRLLGRCLPALVSQSYRDFEIIVVDNGSTDDSVPWVKARFPDVRVLAQDRNIGFAAACNRGIQASSGEFIVTLNNDTSPHPDWLARLAEASDQHPDVGMFASTLYLDRVPPAIDAVGIKVNRFGAAQNIGHGQSVTEIPSSSQPLFGPCAGAGLYRRRLLDDVGLFDESYFAYLEDVELAWRARWAGWDCISVPASRVLHAHSATGGQNLPLKFWLLGRNRIWTWLRHYPRPHLWYYLPAIVLHELFTGILAMIALRNTSPMKGRLHAIRAWRQGLQSPSPAPRRLSSSENFALLTAGIFPQQHSSR